MWRSADGNLLPRPGWRRIPREVQVSPQGLQALLRDARAGRFEVVIAEASDRLSRSQGGSPTIHGNPKGETGLLNNELYIGRRVWNRQRLIKDPETGKRQARPNEEAALVVQEAAELRIVDEDLWNAVKPRAATLTLGGPEQKPWDRRGPRDLFSGLAVCGTGAAGFSVDPGRLGCSAARNKGNTVCTNHATIAHADLEGRVLHALSEHLTDSELVRVFCEEYTAELNRLRAEAGAQRGAKAAELERV